ncbi:MAG: hypothetical protein QNL98_15185 [Mycobacterium sp.]
MAARRDGSVPAATVVPRSSRAASVAMAVREDCSAVPAGPAVPGAPAPWELRAAMVVPVARREC